MSLSIILGTAWVLAATGVALLPLRRQYAPGLALLILAPMLILFIGYEHGVLPGLLALAAFVSMFRNPLRYLWGRATGRGRESAE
ncbi:DUF2484 family protein [Ruegeria marina]|uniref:UDP-N-acetylmuramate--alanine ligase n=1 Tax=Ruegeria marina TaxID=639004 RepID=A0A1G6SJR4_9RHOB|nr:DUF2484 family protein [Ruegeria marina]SDD16386.1 Protein of unknown function [Ruegeria marina]